MPVIKKFDFQYNNLMHSAVVSVCGTTEEMFVHVQLINSFLKKIFGIEHIRFFNRNGQIQMQELKHPFMSQIAGLISIQLKPDLQEEDTSALRVV
ncbi:MAG: hypothetical protein ACXVBZ_12620 [Flavisolibacter sp.]